MGLHGFLTFRYYHYLGPDGRHSGWFLRSVSIWFEAVVKYYHTTDVERDDDSEYPSSYLLFQNYPNPFNATTDIRYQMSDVRSPTPMPLTIYNILSQKVKTLVDVSQESGSYTVTWDGRDESGLEVASGVYFYRIEAGNFTATRKMLLMK